MLQRIFLINEPTTSICVYIFKVSESDLVMAEKFEAIIYAFNTSVQPAVAKEAEDKDVSIR